MAEQSHREEMSAAIRAQRRRQAVPRSIAPSDVPPLADPSSERATTKSSLARALGRLLRK